MTGRVIAADGTDEVQELLERFGTSLRPLFDGPAAECPACRGAVDQLTLALGLAGIGHLSCAHCGAVLAA